MPRNISSLSYSRQQSKNFLRFIMCWWKPQDILRFRIKNKQKDYRQRKYLRVWNNDPDSQRGPKVVSGTRENLCLVRMWYLEPCRQTWGHWFPNAGKQSVIRLAVHNSCSTFHFLILGSTRFESHQRISFGWPIQIQVHRLYTWDTLILWLNRSLIGPRNCIFGERSLGWL